MTALSKSILKHGNIDERHAPLVRAGFYNLLEMEQLANVEQTLVLLKDVNDYSTFNFVCSHAKEGVSTIVANLAQLLSANLSDKSVLLIDANSKNPCLQRLLDNSSSYGLCDVLRKYKTCEEVIHPVNSSNKLYLLPYGPKEDDGMDCINRRNIFDLLRTLRTQYDYILIDSSPILDSSTALSFALAADTTMLVIQAYGTTFEVCEKSKNYLLKNKCDIGGVILNRVKQVVPKFIFKHL